MSSWFVLLNILTWKLVIKGGRIKTLTAGPGRDNVPVRDDVTLTFEQRRELLRLQTEMEKLAVEKLRGETELKRLELEGQRFACWRSCT